MKYIKKLGFIFILLSLISTSFQAQTLDHISLDAEQVAYAEYHTPNLDIYLPRDADSLVKYIVEHLDSIANRIEDSTQFQLSKKPAIIIYPHTASYQESNIGSWLSSRFPTIDVSHTGTLIQLIYRGNREQFLADLSKQYTLLFIKQKLQGTSIDQVVESLLKEPFDEWFIKGIAAYVHANWSIDKDQLWRQLLMKPIPKTFQELARRNPELSGQALFYFIESQHTSPKVYQFFYFTHQLRDVGDASLRVFKKPLWKLQEECLEFYITRYLKDTIASWSLVPLSVMPLRLHQTYTSVVLSHQGKYLAMIENTPFAFILSVRNADTPDKILWAQKTKHATNAKPYFVLQWDKIHHNRLFFTLREKGETHLYIHHITDKGQLRKMQHHVLEDLDEVQAISSSSVEHKLIITASYKGKNDLYEYNLIKKSLLPITDDYYDQNVVSTVKDDHLIIKSNNPSDTFFHKNIEWEKSDTNRIFLLEKNEYQNVQENKVGTFFAHSYRALPSDARCFMYIKDSLYYVSSKSGFTSLFVISLYEFSSRPRLLFQLQDHVLDAVVNSNKEFIFCMLHHDTIQIYRTKLNNSSYTTMALTQYVQELIRSQELVLLQRAKDADLTKATAPSSLLSIFSPDTLEVKKYKDSILYYRTYHQQFMRSYKTKLYSNEVLASFDNNLYINTLQPYRQNQGQFRQPVLGGLMKYSFSDLFENYRATMGLRIPGSVSGSDFFLEFDNYKRRLDWGLSYFRHVERFTLPRDSNWAIKPGIYSPSRVKQKSHYLEARLQYPLNYRTALKAQLALRHDRHVFTALDDYSTHYPDTTQAFSIAKLEWCWNRSYLNQWAYHQGVQANYFVELQSQLGGAKRGFIHSGARIQYNLPIYKHLYWSQSFRIAVSGGESEGIMYVLGGIANAISPQTDSSIVFNSKASYQYISFMSGLRGYAQNIRSGNAAYLYNSEWKAKILPLFFDYHTAFSSLNHLQLILFTDIGNAWRMNYEAMQSPLLSYGIGVRTILSKYYIRLDVAFRTSTQLPYKNPMLHVSFGRE